jgi:hypothetical protein
VHRIVLHDVDADIGIWHIGEHQGGSRPRLRPG